MIPQFEQKLNSIYAIISNIIFDNEHFWQSIRLNKNNLTDLFEIIFNFRNNFLRLNKSCKEISSLIKEAINKDGYSKLTKDELLQLKTGINELIDAILFRKKVLMENYNLAKNINSKETKIILKHLQEIISTNFTSLIEPLSDTVISVIDTIGVDSPVRKTIIESSQIKKLIPKKITSSDALKIKIPVGSEAQFSSVSSNTSSISLSLFQNSGKKEFNKKNKRNYATMNSYTPAIRLVLSREIK